MWIRLCTILIVAIALEAQQPVAPTPEQAGPPAGADTGDYNVTNSFETGYRFATIGGDVGKYRSDVNYGDGIRLLGSSLSVDSRDGHGKWFDQILLNTQGLGNDPFESANLRVEKNGLYQYDLLWRMDDFFNPGLTISAGLHQMDTSRRLQDHDFTLLPQSKVKFHAGYSRNTQDGPALSSVQEFGIGGNPYPVFMNVRREWNEYRVGADVDLAGFKFTVLRRWDYFKDDSPYNGVAPVVPNPFAPPPSTLNQFSRSEPYHGSSPGWLGNLISTHKYWAINARMTYNGGRQDFALDESAFGLSLGAAANRQILVSGNADRPEVAGDFSISLFPTDHLTFVNNTSVHNFRTVGDSTYTEFDNSIGQGTSLNFRYLGVRTLANAADLNYRLAKWLGVYAGYHYSDRLITTIEGFAAAPSTTIQFLYPRDNHLQTGTAGVRIRPVKPLTINLEGEIGRDNLPFTPISDRNYHSINGQVRYRARTLQFSAEYRQVYNINAPVPLTVFSSHSRTYSADASWSPKNWFSLDASYTRLHLDTTSGLVFFAGAVGVALRQTPTVYLSNIHSGTLSSRFALNKRVDLFVGYSITRDVGDGRSSAIVPGIVDPVQALLSSVETFPLTYESPLARLSIKISSKLRWNAGYQFYRYREDFGVLGYLQNYQAHTGYSSLSWSF